MGSVRRAQTDATRACCGGVLVAGRAGPLSGQHESWCRHNVSRPLSSWAPVRSQPTQPSCTSSSTCPPHQLHTPSARHNNLHRGKATQGQRHSAGERCNSVSSLPAKRASTAPRPSSSTPQRAPPGSSRSERSELQRLLRREGLLCRTSLSPPVRARPLPCLIRMDNR